MKRLAYTALAIELIAVALFAATYDSLDFRIYMLGGEAFSDGASLYLDRHSGLWFTNAPFAALIFAPLSALPLTIARVTWQLASVAAFAHACAVTLELAGRRPSRPVLAATVAAGLALAPMWHSLFQGQINLFLLALVMFDMKRISQGRKAGIGIGIATAIKLTPGIFILLLLVTRRTKSTAIAAAAFAACTLAAWAAGPDASRVYWLHTFFDTSRVGAPYISNQSPYGAAIRILDGAENVDGWYTFVPPLIALGGLALAAALARRGDRLAAIAVTGTTGLLVSPISWAHHWVWIVPALAVLIRDGHRITAACAYLTFAVAPMWLTPHDGGPDEYGFHGPVTLVANAYLASAIAFLAYMYARTRREHPTSTLGEREHGQRQVPSNPDNGTVDRVSGDGIRHMTAGKFP
ncbi:glycosyltransferase 87 family protein [Actinomadura algeriensis]|uniref:Alpha-1,2-mannosyltransferase n=1 Tax=Actinomadura algeriensis TaxID=1679523 RepID=A0ABR9JS90_9ACTN|nr:glycosyltransferase 87 family protein [Actinomadura algeriensis]MBE1533439.1 alpha-1,2-mannosyltransferase [Actinomadura algeriensis]